MQRRKKLKSLAVVPVEFFDNTTGAKFTEEEFRKRKWQKLRSAFRRVSLEWPDASRRRRSCPRLKRIMMFWRPGQFWMEYTVEFEDFYSVSCELPETRIWDSQLKLVRFIRTAMREKITELQSSATLRNEKPPEGLLSISG